MILLDPLKIKIHINFLEMSLQKINIINFKIFGQRISIIKNKTNYNIINKNSKTIFKMRAK